MSSEMAAHPSRSRLTADERREQIIESARRVFVRHGLAGTRTRDLALEAGVNEALIYQHFRSKEALFEAAVAEPLERAVATLVELSGRPPETFDETGDVMYARTHQFVVDLLSVMDDVAPLIGVMLFGQAETAESYFRERLAPTLDSVCEVIEANLAHWTHREFDPETLVQLVFGGAWFATLSDRLTGQTRSRDEIAGQITDAILNGVLIRSDGADGH